MDSLGGLRGIVEELPPDRLPEAIGALAEALAVAHTRLLENGSAPAPRQEDLAPESDRLFDVNEAAEMLGVDTRWLYRRADRLPFTRRLGPRTLRFSEAALRRWIEARK